MEDEGTRREDERLAAKGKQELGKAVSPPGKGSPDRINHQGPLNLQEERS